MFDTWRARRAILGHQPPSTVSDPPPEALTRVVEGLRPHLGELFSVGDPIWHLRWEGPVQLMALDARERSQSDVRQRLLRSLHELDLRHLPRQQRRVLAVLLCRPEPGESVEAWHERLIQGGDDGLQGDWRAVRGRVSVLTVLDDGSHRLFDQGRLAAAGVAAWEAAARDATRA